MGNMINALVTCLTLNRLQSQMVGRKKSIQTKKLSNLYGDFITYAKLVLNFSVTFVSEIDTNLVQFYQRQIWEQSSKKFGRFTNKHILYSFYKRCNFLELTPEAYVGEIGSISPTRCKDTTPKS